MPTKNTPSKRRSRASTASWYASRWLDGAETMTRILLNHRRCHERHLDVRAVHDGASDDDAGVVDVLRDDELIGERRADQSIEILHDAVLPEERPVGGAARDPYHLLPPIDAEALTVVVAPQRAEVPAATGPGPEEGMRVEIDADGAA